MCIRDRFTFIPFVLLLGRNFWTGRTCWEQSRFWLHFLCNCSIFKIVSSFVCFGCFSCSFYDTKKFCEHFTRIVLGPAALEGHIFIWIWKRYYPGRDYRQGGMYFFGKEKGGEDLVSKKEKVGYYFSMEMRKAKSFLYLWEVLLKLYLIVLDCLQTSSSVAVSWPLKECSKFTWK